MDCYRTCPGIAYRQCKLWQLHPGDLFTFPLIEYVELALHRPGYRLSPNVNTRLIRGCWPSDVKGETPVQKTGCS